MFRLMSCLSAALLLAGSASAATPRVVTSIAPLHSLVTNVMLGVGEPTLIVRGGQSVHWFQLPPSMAVELHQADIVFWVGRGLETFLPRILDGLAAKTRIVAFLDRPGMQLLGNRTGGILEQDRDDPNSGDEPGQGVRAHGKPGDPAAVDPHIWLDPVNAARIVEITVETLIALDPARASRYRENGLATVQRIEKLQAHIAMRLRPVSKRGYVVVHDAYQYFETRFGLTPIGSLSLNPDQPPSLYRLQALRIAMSEHQVSCAFNEAQFSPKLVSTLVEGTKVRVASLDSLGAHLAPGPDSYFRLMQELAESMVACLEQS